MPDRKLLLTIGLVLVSQTHAQCPSTKIISSRPWERANFGESVEIHGDVAVVSDRSDRTHCTVGLCSSGAVHTFRRIDGQWMHESVLFHSRISDNDSFGVDLSLDRLARFAASAPAEDVRGENTGAVYIFEHNGEAWHEVAEVLPVEPQWATQGGFGGSLLLRGDTLIVGQPKFWITEGFVGAAWVYRLVDGRWEFTQKLMAPDPRPNARFGNALALDGEWLAVGARNDDEAGHLAGAVYLFRRQPGGAYEFHRKVLGPTDPFARVFGADVAIEDDRLAVGSASADGAVVAQGAVYIFELRSGEWRHIDTLQHNDPQYADALGSSVTLLGNVVVAGAPRYSVPGLTVGVAYAFRRAPDGSWRQAAKILPPGPSFFFGQAIATDGASVIVGAPKESAGGTSDGGAAHIFDLPCLLCRVDLDGDGELTIFDFLAFQNLFAAGDPRADFDGDGELTFFDFLAFQTEFAAGCA